MSRHDLLKILSPRISNEPIISCPFFVMSFRGGNQYTWQNTLGRDRYIAFFNIYKYSLYKSRVVVGINTYLAITSQARLNTYPKEHIVTEFKP